MRFAATAASVPLDADPRRILIIKPSAIGDVVHTLPVLSLLRRRWPKARIEWLVTPGCAGLLEGHPLLDEIVLFDRRRYAGLWRDPRGAWGLFGFTRDLKQRGYDLVLDLQGLLRSAWLAWKTECPLRVGFSQAREFAPIFYTHRIGVGSAEQHAVDRYLKLAAAIGCGAGPAEFPLSVSDKDRAAVAGRLPAGPFAVLLPGTNWPTKRWPTAQFAALVEPLRQRLGLASVVAGGAADRVLAMQISGATDLTGQTTLGELVALLDRASLVIANDSGPMHIAAALGKPLVALFGPTNPIRTGPYGRADSVLRVDIPCSPCYSRRCSHKSCLAWLTTRPVLALAEAQMAADR
jgi:lipopolysaccharide heptosyltransferase I